MRVAVFIDQQNLYRSAREAYCWESERGLRGNALPLQLARMLAIGTAAAAPDGVDAQAERRLVAVRVYMGLPSQRHDQREYSRALRQIQHWERGGDGLVKVIHRTLRYPPRWQPGDAERPREKGIDVSLAIDLVRGAIPGAAAWEYDLAILVSADTDLQPALELVAAQRGIEAIQTAIPENVPPSLGRSGGSGPRAVRIEDERGRRNLTIPIPVREFERIEDRVDHYQSRAATTPAAPRGRRLPPRRDGR